MPRLLLVAAMLGFAGQAHALAFTLYTSLAGWQAGAGAATLQDFSGYANGTSVLGAQVLPGLTVSTNLGALEVHGADKDIFATGAGVGSRAAGNAYYELAVNGAYRAVGFDIGAFESALPPFDIGSGAVGSGHAEILFSDGFLLTYDIFGGDGGNLFFGVTSDTGITRIRWFEAHERTGGNEETTLDNLRVGLPANTVPEPASLVLVGVAVACLARRRRR